MVFLTINLELEICKKLDLSYNIVHIQMEGHFKLGLQSLELDS